MKKKTISYNKFITNTILISISVVVVLFVIYGTYIQSSSIEKSIRNDAKVVSSLVFQNLYTVMKNGGDKENINQMILELEESIPDIEIKILNPDSLPKDFKVNRENLKVSTHVKDGQYVELKSSIYYKEECLSCHQKVKIGDLAAVTQIDYPILNLKISLKEIVLLTTFLFLITITVFFSIWYMLLKKYFVQPINSLIEQIKKITSHEDLENKVYIDTSLKEVKELEKTFNEQNKKIVESYKDLEYISNTDSLTKVLNRKRFDEYSEMLSKTCKRYNKIFSLMLVDLNGFKLINDTYGHHIGDEILVLFSTLVKSTIRETDQFFRTGGDEFIILFPNTEIENIQIIIDKINDKFEETPYSKKDLKIIISASFGVSQFGIDGVDIDQLKAVADERMYKDKQKNKQKRS
ncbi:hypothetical protein CP965_00195 [Halarcobacter mediterraneus]|uniref:diguanylate cyclase n=1 Tax=Halarcobacter mediterraneus TaxID=2023153 RepID=A0A4Q1AUT5_9BACT|nr:GGDEF domain-containing protein [Halarcobacter mediterraneus]RXK13904.1 hypothetical protein CP965_00195 [Halarcobacter mediterraneus]